MRVQMAEQYLYPRTYERFVGTRPAEIAIWLVMAAMLLQQATRFSQPDYQHYGQFGEGWGWWIQAAVRPNLGKLPRNQD